jgi:hypothetical protein
MIREAIDKILSLGEYKEVTINGRTYSNGPSGITPIIPPSASTLTINTLTGIDDFEPSVTDDMIHVVDHRTVRVIDKYYPDGWLTRSTHLNAVHESPAFAFGRFMDAEDFIIALQAMFVQDENTAAILKIVGNIKDEAVTQYSDDGTTQAVTARAGISRVEVVPVPNPVTLRPYRTFMEVEQPASTFVFRMQSGKGQPPSCALFEADGRMWRLEAIKNIKAWLSDKMPAMKIIA